MRQLAMIADTWDRGYGHFTTRQNIQFNWPRLRDVPEMLSALADVQMHAIQTSGNTIRNVTADHFAGAAADEIADPRPMAELLRQWSTDHPEFQFLPRKFKIAVTGSPNDRAVTRAHDIGLRMVRDADGRAGVRGDRGRRAGPHADDRPGDPRLPAARPTCCPMSRPSSATYNLLGRRDNKFKARIKITVLENGLDTFRDAVEARFQRIRRRIRRHRPGSCCDAIEAPFAPPAFAPPVRRALRRRPRAIRCSAPGPTPT